MRDTRILGVDPSLSCTGWAIVNDRGDCLRSGSIRPRDAKASARVRGWDISHQVAYLVHEMKPTHVFMEEPTLGGHPSVSQALERLNGTIGMGIAIQTGCSLKVEDVNVKEWRLAVGFTAPKRVSKSVKDFRKLNEKHLKDALIKHAAGRWPSISFSTADAAEAALIALRGLMHVDGCHPIVVKPRKVHKKSARSAA